MDNHELDKPPQEFQDGEERFRKVFDAANDAMALSDAQGIVIEANPAYFELYGYSAEEVIGHSFAIIFPQDYRQVAIEEYQQVFLGERNSLVYESDIQRKDGTTRNVETRIGFLMRSEQRIAMLSVIRDVTERKQTELVLQQYALDLKRSNAELDIFASIASHDLQEPLRMITGYLQLLEKRYSNLFDQNGHDFINFAVDGATRMKAMIHDLLVYSRLKIDKDDLAPFNIEDALKAALSNLEMLLVESKAKVSYESLPVINGNERQFVQLFQNLIGNAIKFHGEQSPVIQIDAHESETEWHFTVSDNGIGMSQADLERIFIIFTRLHPVGSYSGTGIGLAICKKVVEQHGGRLWAESRVHEGTTFHFTIPISVNGNRDEIMS